MTCNNCRFLGPKLETYPGVNVHQCRHQNHAKAVTSSVELAALEMIGKQEGVTACCQCPDKQRRAAAHASPGAERSSEGGKVIVRHNVNAHGYGDAAVCAMLAAGLVGTRTTLRLAARGGMADLLRSLGTEPIPADEVAPRQHPCRWDISWARFWASTLRVPYRPKPLTAHLAAEAVQWAQDAGIDRDTVLMFPERSRGADRHWSVRNWQELERLLAAAGLKPRMMLPAPRPSWPNAEPITDWNRIVAAIALAGVTLGIESGPCHVAGAIGAQAVALMGPTHHLIYEHVPSVLCLAASPDVMPCVGCYHRGDQKPICGQGCLALFNLHPEDVAAVVLRVRETLPPPIHYEVRA